MLPHEHCVVRSTAVSTIVEVPVYEGDMFAD
jgi:predicted nucleic acid-binding Zn ribbon protein